MAVIGVKSITGITSITNAAGGADVLTFHSNNTTERLRITSAGLISIGDESNLDSQLTITQAQGDCIRLRTNTTNNTFKYGIIKQEPYNNNALGIQIVGAKSDSGYTEVDLGGGIDGGYAATQLDFWTAANTTTATGTRRLRIDSSGEIISYNGTLRRNVSDSSFTVSGDTASNTGSNINLYGASHGSLANVFRVRTGSTERLRIGNSGKVNITPGGGLSGSYPPGDLNIVGTNFLTMTPNDNSNASDNEVLGHIAFLPYAAGNIAAASAKIAAVAESGQSGSANPTSLKFYTKPSGVGPGSSGTERLRLTGGGQLIQYTTHTTGNSFHQNTSWYGDDASQYTIEIRDFNEMYAVKTANSNSYQQIIYKREKMTHNCDIEFMLAGGSDQASSNWYHLAMTICGDGSDTMSNFDKLIFRAHGNTASSNHIRVDKGGGGTAFTSQGTHIPQFFDGNDRHIQIKIRGRRYSVYSDGVELMTQYADADNPRQNGFFGFAIYEASTVNPWLKIRDFKLQNYSLNTSLPSWDVVKSVPASTNNAYHYTVTDLNNPRTVEIRFWRLRHSGATGRMLMRLGPSSGYITSGYYDIGTWRSDSDGGATITRGHNQGQWWPLNYDFNNPTNYYSGCITLRRISNSGRNTRIIYESTVIVDYDGSNTQYFINNSGQMTFANSNAWDRLTFYNESSSAVLNYGELEILAQH